MTTIENEDVERAIKAFQGAAEEMLSDWADMPRDELDLCLRAALASAKPVAGAGEMVERLRKFEISDDLGNGDFSVCIEAADKITALAAENERLKAVHYSPAGDNHHNAARCPYCSPEAETVAAKAARAEAAEAKLEEMGKALAAEYSRAEKDASDGDGVDHGYMKGVEFGLNLASLSPLQGGG